MLGTTGEKISIIGFGGIVVAQIQQKDADNYVAEAIEKGVTYFDVAPTYSNAEDRLGPALESKRKDIFLACKTEKRTKKEAQESLDQSLKKLRTDHFDLFQLHAMSTMADVDQVFSADGAMEVFIKAKKEGKVRFIGFSAHSEEAAIALMDRFEFDSILFPVNWVSIFNSKFGVRIMEKANQKNIGKLALKAMARTNWAVDAEKTYSKCWYEPINDRELAALALRYTLSQPITAAISPGHIELLRWAMDTAQHFKPISQQEIELLRESAKNVMPIFPII